MNTENMRKYFEPDGSPKILAEAPGGEGCAVSPCSLSEEAMSELAAKVANDITEDIDCRESRATLREVIRWWSLRCSLAYCEASALKTEMLVAKLAVQNLLSVCPEGPSLARNLAENFLKANNKV